MPTKSLGAKKHPPKVGPNIVRAWFDTALNPLLRRLAVEEDVLGRKDWTWRFQPPRLLSIAPVRAYADSTANLEHFLEFYPGCQQLAANHDEQVEALFNACKAFHQRVATSTALRNAFRQTASAELPGGKGVADMFGAYTEEYYPDVLAELIVNATEWLPGYYATAPLWNPNRERFLAVRNEDGVRTHWESTERAGRKLLGTTRKLAQSVESAQKDLSLTFDAPLEVSDAEKR
jgi:hypothetical protein